MNEPGSRPALSVVIPVCNERDNVASLAREIHAALNGRGPFEILFVDDGSTDDTVAVLEAVRREHVPQIRVIMHSVRSGQSIALRTGVREARADWVATLDGDGQNDPADIPSMLAARDAAGEELKLVMGHRRSRQDTWVRRMSSRIANGVRRRMLRDDTPDTGCGIKLLHRATFLDLPAFNHMHRFLPALYLRAGAKVVSVPVRHRPRTAGQSKYGIGNRLWVGIVDLFGVRWLIRRAPLRPRLTER
jgi:glycosyltransferase involved in cell wall biosynthesis